MGNISFSLRTEWIGVETLNMFNTGSRLTITKSVLESAVSGLESADSTNDSAADPVKIGLQVRALRRLCIDIQNIHTNLW